MRFILVVLVFLIFSFSAIGQTTYRSTPFQLKKIGVFDPKTAVNKYDVNLVSKEAPFPSGSSKQDRLLRQKIEVSKKFPRNNSSRSGQKTNAALNPVLLDSMGIYWNSPSGKQLVPGGTPNDNHIAVSDDGYLIAAWNTRIYFHDLKADTPLINPKIGFTYMSFAAFAGSVNVSSPFDPKILFDPIKNRFVLMFLSGRTANDSKTVIGFSTSSNPADKWNMYEINGSPLNNGAWSDYPQIAFSNNELFYTVNLLNGRDWVKDFERTLIWQIDKNSGFNGDVTLGTTLYDSIYYNNKALRYLRPVQYGAGPNGNNMYFISNRSIPVNSTDTVSYSYDSLFVAEITDSKASGNAKLKLFTAKVNTRTHTSPLGEQMSPGEPLWTNDSRVLGAIINNGQIQFVGNSIDTTNGNSAIYHGFVNNLNGPIQVKINIVSSPTMDLGFPNISYSGVNLADQDVLIGVNHSGPNDPAGFSSIYYDGQGNYSSVTKIIEGKNYINTFLNGSERWGDYFGMQRSFKDKNAAWLTGYFGQQNNSPGIYVAKVGAPTYAASTQKDKKETFKSIAFPNPTSTRFTLEFSLENRMNIEFFLYNSSGQLIDKLLNQNTKEGINEFSFDVFSLPHGVYVLKLNSNGVLLSTHKVLVK